MSGTEEAPGPTTARATEGGKDLFSFETSDEFSQWGAEAGVLKLDPNKDEPELVFTRYTGGAHCCTQTWIATKPRDAAAWALVSQTAAAAARLTDRGTIASGQRADLILVDTRGERPQVVATIVAGRIVHLVDAERILSS